jgi:hypothetical protein
MTRLSGGRVGHVRVLAHLLALGAGASLLGGCGGGASASSPASAAVTQAGSGAIPGGQPQGALLHLPAGSSEAHFHISAVAGDTWTLTLSAPAAAEISVEAVKADGERLELLGSSHSAEGCSVLAQHTLCLLRFAVGSNVSGGAWTVAARKHGGPEATTSVYLTFQHP